MTLQAIRDELATLVPEGFEAYSTLPSNANLPAVVIDLPESVTFDGSLRYATINIAVIVVLGTAFGPEVETSLLTESINIAKLYAGTSGNSYRSCMVDNVDQFYTITTGSKEALSARINLTLLAEL